MILGKQLAGSSAQNKRNEKNTYCGHITIGADLHLSIQTRRGKARGRGERHEEANGGRERLKKKRVMSGKAENEF